MRNPKKAIHKEWEETKKKRILLGQEINERLSCNRRAQVKEWNRLLDLEKELYKELIKKKD